MPSLGTKPFEERLEYLRTSFVRREVNDEEVTDAKMKHVVVVEQTRAESREHVMGMLKDIEGKGGEGLMLRKPES